MDGAKIISFIKSYLPEFQPFAVTQAYVDELYIKVSLESFKEVALALHRILPSPVMMLFASDERAVSGVFEVRAVFISPKERQWVVLVVDIPQENPHFNSLAKDIYSAALFEREIWEMFGIKPEGHPDLRRLNLHDEVWPQGNFPLRKDFTQVSGEALGEYRFNRVEGEGVFEIPVGPVHAGIIGPGHFRFSVAGEPIVNLELRLGFTHRGVEKLFEGRSCLEALPLAECVSGDAVFAHSLAFSLAAEKISGITAGKKLRLLRAILLELERLYNHVNDISGIALDVGFSFPSAYAALIKESILQLNAKLTGSRYLKKVNTLGGLGVDIDESQKAVLLNSLKKIRKDFLELKKMLEASVSFMDRVDTCGRLMFKTARDLGVVGFAARASGIPTDLRKYFPGVYAEVNFKMMIEEGGDALARLNLRFTEFMESCRLIEELAGKLASGPLSSSGTHAHLCALGYAESARGPVLYWLKTNPSGIIERCKIVDPSAHNWQALAYAVLGNIIPDFPLCNKSFNLSYSGNDL